MSHDVSDANHRARTDRAERDTHEGRALASQTREESFDGIGPRSTRGVRLDLFVSALHDAGAVPLWAEGVKERQTITGWGLNGHLLVTIESEHSYNVLQSLAPGVNSIDALLDEIKRMSYVGAKTLRAEARQVIKAFDRIDWGYLAQQIDDLHSKDRQTKYYLLELIALLSADNRLREACGISRPPNASQQDPAES